MTGTAGSGERTARHEIASLGTPDLAAKHSDPLRALVILTPGIRQRMG